MQKLKVLLLKLLLFLHIRNVFGSVSVISAWKQKFINASIFDDPLIQNEKIAANSDTTCALHAIRLKWPNVLYFNSGLCHLAYVDLFTCKNAGSPTVEAKWLYRDNCPVSATKSKKIGTKCYILGPSQVKLDDAQQYCSDQCGTLAEPDLTQSDIQAFSNKFHTQFVDEIATILSPVHAIRYPWLGFKEESPNGALKHMKSGTRFSGTYSLIDGRNSSFLEGLTLIINPTAAGPLLGAPLVSDLRFPLCQLEE